MVALAKRAKRRARLNKRLAAYSAMAGAIAAGGAQSADAVPQIFDVNVTTPPNGSLWLDVNGGVVSTTTLGGASDFELYGALSARGTNWCRSVWQRHRDNHPRHLCRFSRCHSLPGQCDASGF